MKPVDIIFPEAKKERDNRICPSCKTQLRGDYEFRDALSEKEFEISGLCQFCQDEVFK